MLDALEIEADVLVIGGGLAGTWAAVAAAREGADVILADKGYCGTSGVTATAGPGHWWAPPERRQEAIAQRSARAFGLADPDWMARVLEMTWRSLPTLADYYRFPLDDNGKPRYRALRGPEYLRAMRALSLDHGVHILDQSPALELLLHRDGAIAGARGLRRQESRDWTVRAGAVIIATGGCAFASRLLGSQNNTGDGYLMAAEAGADFSGMEFSSYYTVSPAFSTMTRSMSYAFARYFDAAGREIEAGPGDGPDAVAHALLDGPVFASLERMPEDIRAALPRISPNVLLPFQRANIDPFRQRFEITLRAEGTVRGVGGLRVVDEHCQTRVRGLFAAGDAATRELVAGATSGGGAQNSAWALSSGQWSGRAAARLAKRDGRRTGTSSTAIGEAGLRQTRGVDGPTAAAAVAAMREEMHPLDKNLFRSGYGLIRSLEKLDGLWRALRVGLPDSGNSRLRTREAAAMVATGRWCYRAALARAESRGMHKRLDAKLTDERFAHRLRVGGLDQVWTRAEPASASRQESLA